MSGVLRHYVLATEGELTALETALEEIDASPPTDPVVEGGIQLPGGERS